MVFPGEQTETWTFDDVAKQWYYHRFYDFQPDLNWSNPAVRAEIKKVMGFWLQSGASGFRIDAAPFVLEQMTPGVAEGPMDFSILDDWRQDTQWRAGDAVLLCEANVSADDVPKYCAAATGGPNDRAHMMIAFGLNAKLWLALARGDAEPLVESLAALPKLPAMAQWATFLRNHDELDLSKLTDEQRSDVMAAFAPKADMRIYDRGIRRRLAPMMKGDRRHRTRLLPAVHDARHAAAALRRGDRHGRGPEVAWAGIAAHPDAVGARSDSRILDGAAERARAAGAEPKRLRAEERQRPRSTTRPGFLAALVRSAHPGAARVPGDRRRRAERRRHPATPLGARTRFQAPEGSILLLHNLADTPVVLDVTAAGVGKQAYEVFSDAPYDPVPEDLARFRLNGWGYRWIRLRRGN